MKSALACLALLVLMFSGAFFYSAQMANIANRLGEETKELTNAPQGSLQSKIKKLDEEWSENKIWFSLSIPHGELDRIETDIVRVLAAANAKDGGEFQIAAALLADDFEHIGKLYEASWDNIL